MNKVMDVIVIGSGPAGLTSAIYGKRAGLDILVIDESPLGGGQVTTTYEVDNYPGLPGINGMDLGETFKEHALKCGADFLEATVEGISKKADLFEIVTSEGTYESKAVVAATGAKHRLLGIPGEEELMGMGVSYCATCDGAFFRNKVTAVVGGGDVALEDALYLARGCTKVYLIHRRNSFRGAQVLVDKVKENEKIEIIYDSVVTRIEGEDQVERIYVENVGTKESTVVDVNGIFIAVGMNPTTELLADLVETDGNGYIVAGEDCVTSLEGLYAAGDMRTKKLRQIITAAADGANAINSVREYLNK